MAGNRQQTGQYAMTFSFFRLFIRIIIICLIAICVLFGFFCSFINDGFEEFKRGLPSVSQLASFEPALPTIILSDDNLNIAEIFEERRYPVPYEQISPWVINAFIAAEDARFFEHDGVDWMGFVRASLFYIFQIGTVKQGGSTITQQLAKNVLLNKERTIERKIKDMIVAYEIEKEFPKKKILEMYLNTIFLGNSSYGIEAAALNYFKKSNLDLTLAEAAMIAGLAPAPSAYSPLESYTKAKTRQVYVLSNMLKNNLITEKEFADAKNEPIIAFRAETPNIKYAPYFIEEVKKQLKTKFKLDNLSSSGLKIYTTLNTKIQSGLQDAIDKFAKQHAAKKSFKGVLKHHGDNIENALKELQKTASPLPEDPFKTHPQEEKEKVIEREDLAQDKEMPKIERAIVTEIFPKSNFVKIETATGSGLLLPEDNRWALSTSKNKETNEEGFSRILRKGDEVRVTNLNKEKILEDKKLPLYMLTDSDHLEVAALILDAQSGAVRAMMGGTEFLQSQFNRATQAKRQVGSCIKPLYYAYAMDHGFTPFSLIDSPPIAIGKWRPENNGGKKTGRETLRRALALSMNIPSIYLYQTLGTTQVSKFLNRFGFQWPLYDLSLALGSGSATLLQMVQAYSIFANEGKVAEGFYIKRIEDRNGIVIFENTQDAAREAAASPIPTSEIKGKDPLQLISPESAYITTSILRDTINSGTGGLAKGVSPFAGGKTGTTNGNTDAWFIGLTPNLVGGVWVGFDDHEKSMGKAASGSIIAAPLWKDMMSSAVSLYPQEEWKKPEDVLLIHTDKMTGDILEDGGIIVPAKASPQGEILKARNALYQSSKTEQAAEPSENKS